MGGGGEGTNVATLESVISLKDGNVWTLSKKLLGRMSSYNRRKEVQHNVYSMRNIWAYLVSAYESGELDSRDGGSTNELRHGDEQDSLQWLALEVAYDD